MVHRGRIRKIKSNLLFFITHELLLYNLLTSLNGFDIVIIQGENMNKRSFLKAIGLGVSYVMLPSILPEAKAAGNITNCAELTSAMESMFLCKMGEPRAFMELTKEQAKEFLTPAVLAIASQEYISENLPSNNIIRLTYQTFAYSIKGGSTKDAERKLSQYFYDQLKELDENDKKLLVWRVKPHFISYPVTKYGKTWMTAENIEDRTDLTFDEKINRGTWDDKTGHFIPWIFKSTNKEDLPPINIPEGVEYDHLSGALKYVDEKYDLHVLRMRMVLPEMRFDIANDLIKPEGGLFPMLERV